jgi:hypothetical protein
MKGDNNNNNRRKKRKQSNGHDAPSGNSASGSNKLVPGHPWTGMVQAWPMLHWCPTTSGLLGMHPPLPHQALLAAAPGSASTTNFNPSAAGFYSSFGNASAPPGLAMAFNTMVSPGQYQGGDWFMVTGASGHAANDVGIVSSHRPASSSSHIIVGNGAPLPIRSFGSTTIPSSSKPLSLNNVMIAPGIIKNLISVRSFTRDNWVSIEFDPFGFSIKDLLTEMVLLRCDSTSDLYPLRMTSSSTSGHNILSIQLTGDMWHARLGHPGHRQLSQILRSFDFTCSKDTHSCSACQLGKNVRLLFSQSNKVAAFPFHLLHCDVWTSPVVSNSGFK